MRIAMTALMILAIAQPAAGQGHRDTRLYHVRGERALSCADPNALLALSEPNAHERWGEINFARIAADGRCGEVGNSRRYMICFATQRISFVAQVFYGAPGRCYYMLTSALADDQGRSPVPGASN